MQVRTWEVLMQYLSSCVQLCAAASVCYFYINFLGYTCTSSHPAGPVSMYHSPNGHSLAQSLFSRVEWPHQFVERIILDLISCFRFVRRSHVIFGANGGATLPDSICLRHLRHVDHAASQLHTRLFEYDDAIYDMTSWELNDRLINSGPLYWSN